jgi:hypothetical protein
LEIKWEEILLWITLDKRFRIRSAGKVFSLIDKHENTETGFPDFMSAVEEAGKRSGIEHEWYRIPMWIGDDRYGIGLDVERGYRVTVIGATEDETIDIGEKLFLKEAMQLAEEHKKGGKIG